MEQQQQEQHYIKGFNNGYQLAKHEPELAALLARQGNEHNPYFQGLIGGKEQYDKEVREWAKGFSRNAPAQEDRGLEKEDQEFDHER